MTTVNKVVLVWGSLEDKVWLLALLNEAKLKYINEVLQYAFSAIFIYLHTFYDAYITKPLK